MRNLSFLHVFRGFYRSLSSIRIGRFLLYAGIFAALSACASNSPSKNAPESAADIMLPEHNVPDKEITKAVFDKVVKDVEAVAVKLCEADEFIHRCDYEIVIDPNKGLPPNAFHTLKVSGRPLILFTQALLPTLQNEHELAFITAHEMGHHLKAHIPRTRSSMVGGAVLGAALAGILGIPGYMGDFADLGTTVGQRVYSKNFELEADTMATTITIEAGYDPLVGAEFFTRIADPGDVFLGTHPPNPVRIARVIKTAKEYENANAASVAEAQ